MSFNTIFKSVWFPMTVWLTAVISVGVIRHQPGVVCVTPMAWLLASWVGWRCAVFTRAPTQKQRLAEGALAGALLGLLQGLLFIAVVPLMGDIRPDERAKTVGLSIAMIIVGMLVGALVSTVIVALQERHRGSSRAPTGGRN